MPDQRKVLTLASEKECEEVSAAIFEQWRKETLARTGAAEIDCYLDGKPLPVQITKRYAARPPPVVDDNGNVITPSDPRALLIDDVVEAMQGRKVAIPGGKEITIDVSAAVPWAAAASATPAEGRRSTVAKPTPRRAAVVSAYSATAFGAVAAGAHAFGAADTWSVASGFVAAVVAASVALLLTKEANVRPD